MAKKNVIKKISDSKRIVKETWGDYYDPYVIQTKVLFWWISGITGYPTPQSAEKAIT